MESYDQILIGSFYALPAFQETFGFDTGNGTYQLSASWQSALSEPRPRLLQDLMYYCCFSTKTLLALVQNVGLIIGIFANGFLVDRLGSKSSKRQKPFDLTMLTTITKDLVLVQISLVFVTGFVAILFCAKSAAMLLIGELLLGFPLGTINTIARKNPTCSLP